jgi:hypothetical protein
LNLAGLNKQVTTNNRPLKVALAMLFIIHKAIKVIVYLLYSYLRHCNCAITREVYNRGSFPEWSFRRFIEIQRTLRITIKIDDCQNRFTSKSYRFYFFVLLHSSLKTKIIFNFPIKKQHSSTFIFLISRTHILQNYARSRFNYFKLLLKRSATRR